MFEMRSEGCGVYTVCLRTCTCNNNVVLFFLTSDWWRIMEDKCVIVSLLFSGVSTQMLKILVKACRHVFRTVKTLKYSKKLELCHLVCVITG